MRRCIALYPWKTWSSRNSERKVSRIWYYLYKYGLPVRFPSTTEEYMRGISFATMMTWNDTSFLTVKTSFLPCSLSDYSSLLVPHLWFIKNRLKRMQFKTSLSLASLSNSRFVWMITCKSFSLTSITASCIGYTTNFCPSMWAEKQFPQISPVFLVVIRCPAWNMPHGVLKTDRTLGTNHGSAGQVVSFDPFWISPSSASKNSHLREQKQLWSKISLPRPL